MRGAEKQEQRKTTTEIEKFFLGGPQETPFVLLTVSKD